MAKSPTVDPAALFDGIAARYERPAIWLSYGQYQRWHRRLLQQLAAEAGPLRGQRILDVCTGTGLVAARLAGAGAEGVALDLSTEMLHAAQRKLAQRAELVQGSAIRLPFLDGAFDAVVFTYLLRYVDAPDTALRELARIVRPGGTLASLEFYLPPSSLARAGWEFHARLVLPLGTLPFGPGWRRVGTFLGGSIRTFYARNSLATIESWWRTAGIAIPRSTSLSLGAAVITAGRKEPA